VRRSEVDDVDAAAADEVRVPHRPSEVVVTAPSPAPGTRSAASARQRLGFYFLTAVMVPLALGVIVLAVIVDHYLIGLPPGAAEGMRAAVRGWAIMVLGIGALAALVLANLAGRQITAPLRALADALAESATTLESRVKERTRELEAARQELEEKSRRGEEVDRLKSVFIANMSHEIRTPLNSVLALSQLLRDGVAGGLTAGQRQYLEVIERNGQNLLRLINDILDLSRIEAGHLEMDTQSIDLAPHIRAIAAELAPLAMAKELELVVKIPESLPAVRCDVDRVRQILTNLIGNAIKFTESGTVQVAAEAKASALAVSVVDTGVGIPEADINKIFREFFQVDQTLARRQGGTGLGLAIASRLAQLMGGEIGVTSLVGHGSRFTLTLPRAGAAAAMAATLPGTVSRSGETTTDETLQGTVLIVEDNEDNLFTLRQVLSRSQLTLETAANGRQAIALCRRALPDLVIMDMQMPGMSGLQATGAIRALPGGAAVPILALTAQAMKGDRERILAAGCDAYLSKPVDPRALVQTVDRLLAGRQGPAPRSGTRTEAHGANSPRR
jgi:signal transduction histidine kinase/ActR/RegA family two-component response regulator